MTSANPVQKRTIGGVATDLRSDEDPLFLECEETRWRGRLDPTIVPRERLDLAKRQFLQEPGNLVRFGYGWADEVERDSELRLNNDGLTNPRLRMQLLERPFATIPYMGRGGGDTGVESMLLPGNEERDMKSCLPKSTAAADRLDVPMHWNPQRDGCVIFPGIRGGEGTRAAMRRPLKVPAPIYATQPFQGSYQKS